MVVMFLFGVWRDVAVNTTFNGSKVCPEALL